jgi:hypothetical protein
MASMAAWGAAIKVVPVSIAVEGWVPEDYMLDATSVPHAVLTVTSMLLP